MATLTPIQNIAAHLANLPPYVNDQEARKCLLDAAHNHDEEIARLKRRVRELEDRLNTPLD